MAPVAARLTAAVTAAMALLLAAPALPAAAVPPAPPAAALEVAAPPARSPWLYYAPPRRCTHWPCGSAPLCSPCGRYWHRPCMRGATCRPLPGTRAPVCVLIVAAGGACDHSCRRCSGGLGCGPDLTCQSWPVSVPGGPPSSPLQVAYTETSAHSPARGPRHRRGSPRGCIPDAACARYGRRWSHAWPLAFAAPTSELCSDCPGSLECAASGHCGTAGMGVAEPRPLQSLAAVCKPCSVPSDDPCEAGTECVDAGWGWRTCIRRAPVGGTCTAPCGGCATGLLCGAESGVCERQH